jgi:transposase
VIELGEEARVFVCTRPADMRRGFDRLAEDAKAFCGVAPIDGGYFVFLSRKRDKVKISYWDDDGFALWYKRLEAGAFRVEERDGYAKITGVDLKLLLRGMELGRIKLRKKVKNGVFSERAAY